MGIKDAVWMELGTAATMELDAGRPIWLGCDGRSVPWLHFRLDFKPKYVKHAAFKELPPSTTCGQGHCDITHPAFEDVPPSRSPGDAVPPSRSRGDVSDEAMNSCGEFPKVQCHGEDIGVADADPPTTSHGDAVPPTTSRGEDIGVVEDDFSSIQRSAAVLGFRIEAEHFLGWNKRASIKMTFHVESGPLLWDMAVALMVSSQE